MIDKYDIGLILIKSVAVGTMTYIIGSHFNFTGIEIDVMCVCMGLLVGSKIR